MQGDTGGHRETRSGSGASALLCLPPAQARGRPEPPLPAATIDCHFHVFADGAKLASPRDYTPHPVTLDDWSAVASVLGVQRGVAIQPSVYGFDNSVLLSALRAAPDRLRGIVVLPAGTTERQLADLHAQGVRGVRLNLRNRGGLSLSDAEALARVIAPLGWHIEVQPRTGDLASLDRLAERGPVPLVLDHFGLIPLEPDLSKNTATEALLRLLRTGRVHIKLSAPYRLAPGEGSRLGAVVARLAGERPDRLIWGSDWPHTELWTEMPEDTALAQTLAGWLGSDEVRRLVFAENAARLYWRD